MRHFVSSFTTMDNKNKRLAGQLQLHKLYKLDFKSSLSHCFGSVSKFSIGETWCVLDFGSLDREFEVDENLSSGIHRFRLRAVCCGGRLDLSATVCTV